MNSLVESEFPLHETQSVRYDLMQTLTDNDLAYKLPGDNPTLGELCREIGDVEYSYIQSFKTFNHDWSYRTTDPELATSVERLQAWYTTLDNEFETVLRGFSGDDLSTKSYWTIVFVECAADPGRGVAFCCLCPTCSAVRPVLAQCSPQLYPVR